MSAAATFAASFAALYAAHEVADHWLQRDDEAVGKGRRDRRGRWLCARHVAVLTVSKTAALTAVAVVLAMPLAVMAVVAALAVDAASHYWADRRTTLVWLAERTGKGAFAHLGDGGAAPAGTGAYALDQSWHIGWLFVAALIIAGGSA